MNRLIRLLLLVFLTCAYGEILSQELFSQFDRKYGPDPQLYNGKQYSYFLPSGTQGMQYLFTEQFIPGQIRFNYGTPAVSERLRDLPCLLNFDIYNQKVLIKFMDHSGTERIIEVPDALVAGFTLGSLRFESQPYDKGRRFFQVLGSGNIRVLYYYRKTLKLDNSTGTAEYRFSDPLKSRFVMIGNQIRPFSSDRGFAGSFDPTVKAEIKNFIKQHRLRLKDATDEQVEALTGFIQNLYLERGLAVDATAAISNQAETEPVVPVTADSAAPPAGVILLERLPEYRVSGESHESDTGPGMELTRAEERYLTGRKADVPEVLKIGQQGRAGGKATATIRGRISESQTGEPVIGATIFLEETASGSASDQNGIISLTVKPGIYTAVFASMGYERKKYQLEIYSDGEFTIEMDRAVIQMMEVVVMGDRQMNIRYTDPGMEKIPVKSIREIPTMMGERDILKISEMLPGIVTVGEGSSGLNVRGGNYDQNAFLINKIPIYNTSHMFGFFPAFNADIIRDFSIYKGHIPAAYGGRLSSVFNITARQGNRKKFSMRGGISPVAASLLAEGPLKKDAGSFLVSGRYLYSDWILGQIDDPLISNSQAAFNDFSGALNYDLGKSRLSVFGYYSHDEFRLSDLNRYQYGNSGGMAQISRSFNASLRGEIAIVAAGYTFSTTDEQVPQQAWKQDYRIGDYRFLAGFTHDLNEKNTLEYGLNMNWYRLDRGSVVPYGPGSLRLPVEMGTQQGLETALYLADDYKILPWLNLNAGIRIGLFTPLGPGVAYDYQEQMPMTPEHVTDSVYFSSGEVIRWYFEPDIRVALNFRTDPDGTVKLAFNRMHQNLFMLNNTIAVSPNAQWIMADYHLEPAGSLQASAGVFRAFPHSGWESSLEAYYKITDQYPEFMDGADFLANPQVETFVLPGKQRAYGIEFLLRRTAGRVDGWLAYTWSRALVTVDGIYPWEQINEGMEFPANYDIPHVVNTVVNYHFSRRVTASGVMTYQTGRPVTYPVSVYYVNGVPFLDYSGRNAYRIPDYFRIDLSLTIEGNLRKKKLLHHSLSFSLYNVTGRDNPYSVYFTVENGKINSYRYAVIGVPVFTATWLFKLGNYASE